jgi:patatin-like phospholipase/acyl hydrolase
MDKDGNPRAFNLIDGGVAANNPVSDSECSGVQGVGSATFESTTRMID